MKGHRVSKKAAAAAVSASAYDDVFGGPPRFSGPLAARLHDYAEIFGAGSACSIPFLDLPPAMDGLGGDPARARPSPGFDYLEVFGGFDFGKFAVSYEELFAGSRRRVDVGASDERAPEDPPISHQTTKEPEFSLEEMNEGHMTHMDCVEEYHDCFSANSDHSYHDSKESTVTIHINNPPGFASNVDTITFLQNQKGDAPCSTVLGVINNNKAKSKFLPNSTRADLETSGNEFTEEHKKYTIQCPVLDIDQANLNHHSQTSSSIANEDVPYVSVSGISLRTEPLRVPPPSRPPPKVFVNKDHPMLKTCTNSIINLDGQRPSERNENPGEDAVVVISKNLACQDGVTDRPLFFGVDAGASSAAAASVAAMKEAMELAQTRLKSAKESMEKKRVDFPNCKKLGYLENKKERKIDQSPVDTDDNNEMLMQKILVKEDKQIDAINARESNKIANVANASPDVGETKKPVVIAKHGQYMMQADNLKSKKQAGEGRTNKEHNELVCNEKKSRMVENVSEQEGARKTTEATANISEDNHDENKEATLSSEFENNRNLNEDDERSDGWENFTNLKDDNVDCKKEVIHDAPAVVLVDYLHQEDVIDLKRARVSSSKENENDIIENNTISGRNEESMELLDGHEFQGTHDSKEGNIQSQADKESYESDNNLCNFDPNHLEEKLNSETAKEAFESEDNEKDLSVDDLSCKQYKSENNLNDSAISAVPNEKEMKMTVGSCMCEAGEELNAISECIESEKSMGEEQVKCDHSQNLNQMGESRVAIAQEVREELCLKQESCMLGKDESGLEVDQIAGAVGENIKKLKATELMMHEDPEKPINATEAAFLEDCNEFEAKEAQVEEQKSDKIQEAAQVPSMLVHSEKQNIYQRDHGVTQNEEIKEIHVKPDFSNNSNILNATQDVSGRHPFTDLGTQQETLPEKRGDISESALDSAENYNVGSEKTYAELKKTKDEINQRMERERTWTEIQARKLEEEKERQREREKDRLAVEKATREAHERAFDEARERAERIAVERVTAEARQRALKEAWEKTEKASVLAMEKSLAAKSLREARLRAQRSAVERATAEARERAAEKAAADARERAARSNGSYRDRMSKGNVIEEHFKARNKNGPNGAQFQSTGSSSNCKGYSASNNQNEGESALRCKARLERHQRTAERVAKALAEKNKRDILAQREQTERNRLAQYLDADVKRWSNGKEGNLRALLSTLQYILGPESGWQPISLTDVITVASVKKAYRKATLCVHPDKLQQRGASIQQKYICEKVFDLLKEAWNKFNSEEQ